MGFHTSYWSSSGSTSSSRGPEKIEVLAIRYPIAPV
jgi:hypothetical protein